MDATTSTFLAILKAALSNGKAELNREIPPEEWQRLFHLANIHSLLPMFYEAVYSSASLQKNLPFLAMGKHQAMQQVVTQTMRTNAFLELNQRFHAAGLRPLVVKGIICRNLYPQPDHRPSSDEDVLIPPDRFDDYHRILLEYGMQPQNDPAQLSAAYEVPYRKDGSVLYIELHKHLFPPESEAYGHLNRYFEGVFDRAVTEQIQGHPVCTLGYTDHLFYLICHAFKHFLHSGFGIRQVCDIILYANRYGSQVDWMQILDNCRALHAEKFAAALFRIGSKHLVFDPERAGYPSAWRSIRVDERPMLEDLLDGGLYGDANMSRKHSSNITLDAVASQKQGRRTRNPVVTSVFPPASRLAGRYPYLKQHPYLLPVAWCGRLWTYSKETRHASNNNASDALKIGNERVELLKLYGILEYPQDTGVSRDHFTNKISSPGKQKSG